MLEGYGGGGNALPAGLRQRPLACVPARAPRSNRGRRLLGLARRHARARGLADGRAGAIGLRAGLPRDASQPGTRPWASSTTSGCPRLTQRSRPRPRWASRSCSCSRPTDAAGSTGSARSRRPTTSRSSRRFARPACGSASPPTPCAPARATGSKSSGATPRPRRLPLHVHADEQPREIEECLAEHGLRPIELLAETGLPGPAHDRRPRHACGCARARPARRGRRASLPLPDDRGQPRRRLRARAGALRARASESASAPTRTCASTRSRSCESWRESRVAVQRSATSCRSRASCASAPTKAPPP